MKIICSTMKKPASTSSFKTKACGKLMKLRISILNVLSLLMKWMTQRLKCADTTPTKIKKLREGRFKAPFSKIKGVINHEH